MEQGARSIGAPLLGSVPSGNGSEVRTMGNVTVSIVGTGVLALPFACWIAGWLAGSLGVAIVGVTTYNCMLLLVMCRAKLASEGLAARAYRDSGYRSLGTSGRYLTEILNLLSQCRGSVAYLMFIGLNLQSVFQGHGLTLTSYIFLLVPIEIGLSWIGSLSSLAPFSILLMLAMW